MNRLFSNIRGEHPHTADVTLMNKKLNWMMSATAHHHDVAAQHTGESHED